MFQAKIDELTRRDPRYAYEAYEFLFAALAHAQGLLGRPPGPEGSEPDDVTARQLLDAIRDLALREFGPLAATVFRQWGVRQTDDFGEIVANLASANLMSLSAEDERGDFHAAFDLESMAEGLTIEVPREGEEER
jgi:uncharacterized repeat protein (TIGR04138 family)